MVTTYELYDMFRERYSYISISGSVVADFLRRFAQPEKYTTDQLLDLLRDYVLSQGLEEEIEL